MWSQTEAPNGVLGIGWIDDLICLPFISLVLEGGSFCLEISHLLLATLPKSHDGSRTRISLSPHSFPDTCPVLGLHCLEEAP